MVIFWHRQYRNAFYALFVARASQVSPVLGISQLFSSKKDILLLISSYAHFRLPTIAGTFLLPFYLYFPNWLLVSMLVLYYYSMEASSLATTFLLLNRLSAIIFPLGHEKVSNFTFLVEFHLALAQITTTNFGDHFRYPSIFWTIFLRYAMLVSGK
jgi:hypothetical protein